MENVWRNYLVKSSCPTSFSDSALITPSWYNVSHSLQSMENHMWFLAELSWIFAYLWSLLTPGPIPAEVSHSQKHNSVSISVLKNTWSVFCNVTFRPQNPTTPWSFSLSCLRTLLNMPFCLSLLILRGTGWRVCFVALCLLLWIEWPLSLWIPISFSSFSPYCSTRDQDTFLRMAEPSLDEGRPRKELNWWSQNLLGTQGG